MFDGVVVGVLDGVFDGVLVGNNVGYFVGLLVVGYSVGAVWQYLMFYQKHVTDVSSHILWKREYEKFETYIV